MDYLTLKKPFKRNKILCIYKKKKWFIQHDQ